LDIVSLRSEGQVMWWKVQFES